MSEVSAFSSRHSIRLRGYDYASPGWYFITICTYRKAMLLGEVVEGQMRPNECGRIVQEAWSATRKVRPEVDLDVFIVMPNHFHGIVVITRPQERIIRRGESATRPPIVVIPQSRLRAGVRHCLGSAPASPLGPVSGSVGAIVGQIKSVTTKRINRLLATAGQPVWQRNYYERVIRNEDELNKVREYVCANPERWDEDPENPASGRAGADELEDILAGSLDFP